jgi:hypothetical protein
MLLPIIWAAAFFAFRSEHTLSRSGIRTGAFLLVFL